MNETIVKFMKGSFPKKYTAKIRNKKTKKERIIHFGDSRYQQYKDRTPLGLYKRKDHGTRKRMQNGESDMPQDRNLSTRESDTKTPTHGKRIASETCTSES